MRWLRLAAWACGVLIALVLVAAATLWLDGGPVIAWAVRHPLAAYLGRRIRLDGPVTVRWGATTRLVVEGLHVANAPWGSAPEMFSAQRLEVALDLGSLLRGPLRLPLIDLDGAKLLLETSRRGTGN